MKESEDNIKAVEEIERIKKVDEQKVISIKYTICKY